MRNNFFFCHSQTFRFLLHIISRKTLHLECSIMMRGSRVFVVTIIVSVTCILLECHLSAAEWNKIENPCLCQEFRCKDGVFCLHASKVCNGVPDCVGGEDEKSYNGTGKCVRRRPKCGEDEFKCKFGGCIKIEKVCDGKIDCWGAVDEAIDFCTWVHGNDTDAGGNQVSH